ncbi:unnamed protein product [Polarella glacialis]|uniref:Uncharacterized protein n=1 Tax=Polarella glacialis TaxID=89957 RepID=A0A813FV09_POLGL|nr:unnamed protein product [Polarella glacialis]
MRGVDTWLFAPTAWLPFVAFAVIVNLHYLWSMCRSIWKQKQETQEKQQQQKQKQQQKQQQQEGDFKTPDAVYAPKSSEDHMPAETAGNVNKPEEGILAAWDEDSLSNFLVFAKYVSALIAIILPALLWLWFSSGSESQTSLSGALLCLFSLFSALWIPVASGWVPVTRRTVPAVTFGSYLLILAHMIQFPATEHFLPHGQLRTACAFLLADSRANVPVQLVGSAASLWVHVQSVDNNNTNDLRFACLSEFLAFGLAVILGCLWEHAMWSRTEALFQAKSSLEGWKGLWQAARGLLSGLCDADLELDSDLQILSSSDKLSHMLKCDLSPGSKALEGMPFTNYLDEPDRPRFEESIRSMRSLSKSSSRKCTPAASLHVHILGPTGLKFAAEIYHVAIPTLGDNTKFRHLLGIIEGQSDRWGTLDSANRASEMLSDMPINNSVAAASACSPDLLPLGANFKTLMPSDAWSASKSSASISASRASSGEGRVREIERVRFVIDALSSDMRLKEVTISFNCHATEDIAETLPNLRAWLCDESVAPFQLWLTDHVNAYLAKKEPLQPVLSSVAMRAPHGDVHVALVADEATFMPLPVQQQQEQQPLPVHGMDDEGWGDAAEESEEEEEQEKEKELRRARRRRRRRRRSSGCSWSSETFLLNLALDCLQ